MATPVPDRDGVMIREYNSPKSCQGQEEEDEAWGEATAHAGALGARALVRPWPRDGVRGGPAGTQRDPRLSCQSGMTVAKAFQGHLEESRLHPGEPEGLLEVHAKFSCSGARGRWGRKSVIRHRYRKVHRSRPEGRVI